jgi:hypothetical protein
MAILGESSTLDKSHPPQPPPCPDIKGWGGSVD